MALHELTTTDEKLGRRRLQIMGPPATYKTSLIPSFDRPIIAVGLPGEKHTDILTPSDGLRVLLFPPPDYGSEKTDWVSVWNDIKLETHNILEGKYGGLPKTLVFDGAHKAFYACYLAGRKKFQTKGDEWEGRRGWPWIKDEFLAWFSRSFYSPIEWVIWIVWSAREQDENEPSVAERRKQIWPDYMGNFQQTCMGETNIVYQYLEGGKAYWQIRQDDKVRGVGLRLPPEQATTLPIRIEANWQKLKAILQPQGQEVKS